MGHVCDVLYRLSSFFSALKCIYVVIVLGQLAAFTHTGTSGVLFHFINFSLRFHKTRRNTHSTHIHRVACGWNIGILHEANASRKNSSVRRETQSVSRFTLLRCLFLSLSHSASLNWCTFVWIDSNVCAENNTLLIRQLPLYLTHIHSPYSLSRRERALFFSFYSFSSVYFRV